VTSDEKASPMSEGQGASGKKRAAGVGFRVSGAGTKSDWASVHSLVT
jgi:hypothetical protein